MEYIAMQAGASRWTEIRMFYAGTAARWMFLHEAAAAMATFPGLRCDPREGITDVRQAHANRSFLLLKSG